MPHDPVGPDLSRPSPILRPLVGVPLYKVKCNSLYKGYPKILCNRQQPAAFHIINETAYFNVL